MGRLGDFARRLRRRRTLVGEAAVVPQNGRRVRGAGAGVIGLEPQHVLAGATHRGAGLVPSGTCRGRKTAKVSTEKLRFQQPRVGLVAAFLGGRGLLDQPEGVEPRRWPARNEPVAARRGLGGRRGEARDPPKRCWREGLKAKRGLRHPSWEIQPRFPCLWRIHFFFLELFPRSNSSSSSLWAFVWPEQDKREKRNEKNSLCKQRGLFGYCGVSEEDLQRSNFQYGL